MITRTLRKEPLNIPLNFVSVLAQATKTSSAQPPPQWYDVLHSPMFPIILFVGLMYFFVFRSKKGGDKQRDLMLKQMKRGDRVQTIGGIIGTVVEARDTEIVVKVDEGNNTKIKFARSAIHRVLDEEKAAAK